MSLKPPSLWIEQRGRQHRVYWRNTVPGLRARPYLPFYVRAEAERFIVMAGLLGLDTASQVATTEDPQAAAALATCCWTWSARSSVTSSPTRWAPGRLRARRARLHRRGDRRGAAHRRRRGHRRLRPPQRALTSSAR